MAWLSHTRLNRPLAAPFLNCPFCDGWCLGWPGAHARRGGWFLAGPRAVTGSARCCPSRSKV
eukprot:8173385-Lingulodinium_polyedra.AAC.1